MVIQGSWWLIMPYFLGGSRCPWIPMICPTMGYPRISPPSIDHLDDIALSIFNLPLLLEADPIPYGFYVRTGDSRSKTQGFFLDVCLKTSSLYRSRTLIHTALLLLQLILPPPVLFRSSRFIKCLALDLRKKSPATHKQKVSLERMRCLGKKNPSKVWRKPNTKHQNLSREYSNCFSSLSSLCSACSHWRDPRFDLHSHVGLNRFQRSSTPWEIFRGDTPKVTDGAGKGKDGGKGRGSCPQEMDKTSRWNGAERKLLVKS